MNWQAMSFDWNQVRAFLATAEEGTFSGAARALKSTQPTIGRQISALEGSLGVTLLERSVRGLTLTQAGRELLDHVRAMGEAATLISMVAAGQSQEVTGEVTVTATDLMAAAILPAILAPLRQSAPGIRVRIVATSDIRNLMQREADIAIRHVRPDQPDLIARHVGDFRGNLYAASSYLDRAGRPRTPREVADHAFVGSPDPDRLIAPLHNHGVPVRCGRVGAGESRLRHFNAARGSVRCRAGHRESAPKPPLAAVSDLAGDSPRAQDQSADQGGFRHARARAGGGGRKGVLKHLLVESTLRRSAPN
jgi:DNA-binding transcriptional LysR family regulator